jgi:hypothetical protein
LGCLGDEELNLLGFLLFSLWLGLDLLGGFSLLIGDISGDGRCFLLSLFLWYSLEPDVLGSSDIFSDFIININNIFRQVFDHSSEDFIALSLVDWHLLGLIEDINILLLQRFLSVSILNPTDQLLDILDLHGEWIDII